MPVKCDGCPKMLKTGPGDSGTHSPHHVLVRIKSARINMVRHWAFCGPKCRERWYNEPTEESFAQVESQADVRGRCDEARSKAKEQKRQKMEEHRAAARGLAQQGRLAKDAPELALPEKVSIDEVELDPEEEPRVPAPMFYCDHKSEGEYDRDVDVEVTLHDGFVNGKPVGSASRAKFHCPCVINEWWKTSGKP